MQIGCWIPASYAPLAAEMGYDFVELKASELYPDGPASQYELTKEHIETAQIPARSFNFFLPPTLKIVGPHIDQTHLDNYLGVVMERAAELGGRVMVLGSGGARRIPDGFPVDEAAAQFRAFARAAGDVARRHGLSIALEPLNRTETNLLHTVAEAAAVARQVDHPAVGVLADIYHMVMESEPFPNLFAAKDHLRHIHVCDAGRGVPGSRGFDLWGFFAYLNAVGYTGTVSTECTFRHFRGEGYYTLEFLRQVVGFRGELSFSA